MSKNLMRYLSVGVAATSAVCAYAQADHLLLSEVGVSAGSEYVEIFNPTTSEVPLHNYYLTDLYGYYNLPKSADGLMDANTTDHLMQFPAGTKIQPGQVVVVAGNASTFLDEFFEGDKSIFDGLPNAPQLFETSDNDPTVQEMITHNNRAGAETNFGMTNMSGTNGEFEVLMYWDGVTALVQDVDVVGWGNAPLNSNTFYFKSPADIGGGDGTSTYKTDAGTWANLTNGSTTGKVITRASITEQGENDNGGNGITDDDESTENIPTTWVVGDSIVADVSPGTTNLNVAGANLKPIISSVERTVQFPGVADDIIINANVTDADSASVTVKVYYATNTDSTFTAVDATSVGSDTYSANLGKFTDIAGTLIKYYVEATDSDSTVNRYPGSNRLKKFLVQDAPVVAGDIVINEINYDTPGSDTHEYIELHNTLSKAVKVPSFRISDLNMIYYALPDDAVIQANGYLTVSLDSAELTASYSDIPAESQVYDWGTFGLNNGGDTVNLVHPNEFEFNGVTNLLDQVVYDDVAPWPNGAGFAIELKDPKLDNSLGENWATSVDYKGPTGTPGAANSTYTVADVVSVTRDLEYPAPNAAATINTEITPLGATTVASVQLIANAGGTTLTLPMTASGNFYSAQIPGQPEGTIVTYHLQIEDTSGDISTYPSYVTGGVYAYHVNADPAGSDDIVINEILYDKMGTDNYEWLELYNRRDTPLSLAYFRVGDSSYEYFTFPADAVIGANSFVVVSFDPVAMDVDYDVPVGIPVYKYDFSLGNGGDTIYVTHANSLGYSTSPTPIDTVIYDNVSPWPEIDGNVSGKSIELLDPASDNNVGGNWAGSPDIAGSAQSGTPGAQNTPAAVSDWAIY